MSSISISPYSETLDYWSKKLIGNKHRIKFLLTKCVEIHAFKSIKSDNISMSNFNIEYIDFPEAINNAIPDNPSVSIVIPVYVRTKKDIQDIHILINSINNQTRRPDHVILVDDCSPVAFDYPAEIICHKLSKNSGPAKARNTGKNIALDYNSDIIAFTDSDCILSENWIEKISFYFNKEKTFQILSGNTVSFDKNWFGIYHNINGTLNGRRFKNSDKLLYGTTANFAISKEVATTINFNEDFPLAAGEDIEFCFRANQCGFAIKHVPEMIIFHNYSYTRNFCKNLKSFRRQFQRYGRGEIILIKEIPEYYVYFDNTEEIPALVDI